LSVLLLYHIIITHTLVLKMSFLPLKLLYSNSIDTKVVGSIPR